MATLLTALIVGLSLYAQPGSAATSGSKAFKQQEVLLHKRVARLATETPARRFPIGTGSDGILRFTKGWASGFWPGALWRVVALHGNSKNYSRAGKVTIQHFGREKTRTHDLGFMYGESSVAAYRLGCPSKFAKKTCRRFRKSGLTASRTLYNLAHTTGQGIIPMGAKTCRNCAPGDTETIVDSMMNLPLLYWASKTTGDRKYRNLAKRHAAWVARELIRKDGSTYQAGSYPRRASAPKIIKHTHQGFSDTSVWARGQAWSVYGFADAGREFHSKRLLAVAERNANYIASHLPADKLPKWDYDAPAPAPRDVSAGVITAAGLFHLAGACQSVKNGCSDTRRWVTLARRMLQGSLAGIRTHNPVGYLGNQVYTLGGETTWDDDAELVMGIDYALEAIKLSRASYKG